MKPIRTGILILLIALLLSAGCTQSSPAPLPQPVITATPQPDPTRSPPAETPMAVAATSAPQGTITVINYIVPVKAWKDTELRIAFTTPEGWTVTTRQLSLPEGSQGLEYQTDLVPNNAFYIVTYPISRNQDQAYRDTFRKWVPAPAESTVTYNNIIYERFESTKDGKTQVGYVARKSSASDIGFSSVLVYTTDLSRLYEKEDFEKAVRSFSYLTKDKAAAVSGEEIPRVR